MLESGWNSGLLSTMMLIAPADEIWIFNDEYLLIRLLIKRLCFIFSWCFYGVFIFFIIFFLFEYFYFRQHAHILAKANMNASVMLDIRAMVKSAKMKTNVN